MKTKKTLTLPEEIWEELTKLKLEWRCKTLSNVIVRLLDHYEPVVDYGAYNEQIEECQSQ